MARPIKTGDLRRGQRGITYLVVLYLVALVGMGLASLGTFWKEERQRDNERELLYIGEQFGVALQHYYDASPGVTKEYPHRLEDLLEDKRQPVVRRHLRQIFVDPMTGQRDWVAVMNGGQITAIQSASDGEPLIRSGFPPEWKAFASAMKYSEWVFSPLKNNPWPNVATVEPKSDGVDQARDTTPALRHAAAPASTQARTR